MSFSTFKITIFLAMLALNIANSQPKANETSKPDYLAEGAAKVELVTNTIESNLINTRSRNAVVTENYFHIDRSRASLWNGKHWKSTDFPLKVYVNKTNSRYYKAIYKKYIDYAFQIWQKADHRIKFIYVEKESDANVTLSFENNLMDKYDENFLGLTDYELTKNNKIVSSAIQISLLKFNGKKLNDGEIKATIIHELGHAIGLGHSENHMDIMYPYIDPQFKEDLDFNDLSTGDEGSVKSLMDMGFRFQYSQN